MKKIISFLISISIIFMGYVLVSSHEEFNEFYDEATYTADYTNWSKQNNYRIKLSKKDVLGVEIINNGGSIALEIVGDNENKAYIGNKLEDGIFTVTISKDDVYNFNIKGKKATGSIKIKKILNSNSH